VVLCCAVLCCAVLCCAVLCCAVLCCVHEDTTGSSHPQPTVASADAPSASSCGQSTSVIVILFVMRTTVQQHIAGTISKTVDCFSPFYFYFLLMMLLLLLLLLLCVAGPLW
jgi:hypothetical protein